MGAVPRMIAPMKRRSESHMLGALFQRLAPRVGAKVLLEPTWRIAGQITFRSGKKSYFRYNTLDLNPVGAADIAKDKAYAGFFLGKMGYPTVTGRTFYRDDWCAAIGSRDDARAALRYAKRLGFPLIVKPNSGSQGKNVSSVSNAKELRRALRAVFTEDRIALVQRKVTGRDYRIVVLDGKVISAYERIPLSVVGNGRSTVLQLLRKKQRDFDSSGRDTRLSLNDPRTREKLRSANMSLRTTLPKGEQVFLLDNANLSTGGDAVDRTADIHPLFADIATHITHDMGLRMCGVDLMVDGDIAKRPGRFWVLEVNAAPGLDHYASSGAAQQKIVEDLYLQVLKVMGR
jgi:D-alanine-D-alanine ligase-like ATP-grasp enzyme